jgi:hypothetical protein
MPSAAGTDGGEVDLSPPVLSITKVLGWLAVCALVYAGCVAVGMALGWLIEAALWTPRGLP